MPVLDGVGDLDGDEIHHCGYRTQDHDADDGHGGAGAERSVFDSRIEPPHEGLRDDGDRDRKDQSWNKGLREPVTQIQADDGDAVNDDKLAAISREQVGGGSLGGITRFGHAVAGGQKVCHVRI